ncbi:hypothetical protein EV363DRAFT_1488331 [Boletus edulis]|nr:hypothetical protein EV363DRAFT_1488331 [Boletus edulis]
MTHLANTGTAFPNDLRLKFIEHALPGWEIENLVRASEDGSLKRETVIIHPGFEMLAGLLTNSSLQSTILSYIVDGIEGFEHEHPSEEPYFLLTIIRDVFLDVLVPILSEFPLEIILHTVRSSTDIWDQVYPCDHSISSIPELVLLAVRIISQLSCSTFVTSLLTLVERIPDSERILSSFRKLLDVDSLDDVDTAETTTEYITGAGAADRETQEPPDQAIRTAILVLLIQSEHQIQNPHAIRARRTCAHVILDLVNVGIPRMRTKGKDVEQQRKAAMHAEPLFQSPPSAERAVLPYHLPALRAPSYIRYDHAISAHEGRLFCTSFCSHPIEGSRGVPGAIHQRQIARADERVDTSGIHRLALSDTGPRHFGSNLQDVGRWGYNYGRLGSCIGLICTSSSRH